MSVEHGSVLRDVKKSPRAGVNKNYPQLLTAEDQKIWQGRNRSPSKAGLLSFSRLTRTRAKKRGTQRASSASDSDFAA